MTPERWQQISRIFKSAILLDNEARAAYVDNQCGRDDSLRVEVEKLIESHGKANADEFMNGVAAEAAAPLLTNDEVGRLEILNKGQRVGSYIILDSLGSGGMGEVYLARDTRLDRTVALKVLSPDISEDKRRMQRFRQEAKVASSLNQPNILTVFEFGAVDGLTFLATEYIDGVTLRDHLHGKRLRLGEMLDISMQVLAALDAAHEARIVHRDIKPENVMLRRRDDPAVPSRGDQIADTEVFRNLSMDPRHSRYVETVIGRIDGPPRLEDRRPEGTSNYIRVADVATPPIPVTPDPRWSIRLGPEPLTDLLPSGISRAARIGLAGGDDGLGTISDPVFTGMDDREPAKRTGIFSLKNIDDISIVATPVAGPRTTSTMAARRSWCGRCSPPR